MDPEIPLTTDPGAGEGHAKSDGAGRVALAVVLLLAFFFAFRQNMDPDIGFHLNSGRWIWKHHAVPHVDDFTYTCQGRPYLDQHWLYQAVLYGAFRVGEYPLLTVGNAGLVLLLVLLLWARLRDTRAGPLVGAALAACAILVMEIRFEVRPELVSWVLLAAVMWILDLYRSGNGKVLRYLPFLMALWVNVEALFILGVAVLGLEILGSRLKNGAWDIPLLRWSGLAVLALMLNPYGLEGVLFPFGLWSHMTQSAYAGAIGEYRNSWGLLLVKDPDMPLGFRALYYWLVPAGAVLLFLTRRKRTWHDFLLWGVFFVLSATAQRNIPPFLVATLPLTAVCLKDLFDLERPERQARLGRWLAPLLVLLLLLGARAVTGAHYAGEKRITRFGWGLLWDFFPYRTSNYLLINKLTHLKPVNDIKVGDWLAWSCGIKVMSDGRLQVMSEDVFRDIQALKTPVGVKLVADKVRAEMALLNPLSAYLPYNQPQAMPEWPIVFLEEECLVLASPWLAKRVPPFNWESLTMQRRLMLSPPWTDSLLSEKPIRPFVNWVEGFYRKKEFPYGMWNLAGVALQNKRLDVAEAFYLEILRRTRGAYPLVYGHLSDIYRQNGDQGRLSLCLDRLRDAGLLNP